VADRREPSGSVPSVLLAGLYIFPLIPVPAPNSTKPIQGLLRLSYAELGEFVRLTGLREAKEVLLPTLYLGDFLSLLGRDLTAWIIPGQA
jgi:hypothetical protein